MSFPTRTSPLLFTRLPQLIREPTTVAPTQDVYDPCPASSCSDSKIFVAPVTSRSRRVSEDVYFFSQPSLGFRLDFGVEGPNSRLSPTHDLVRGPFGKILHIDVQTSNVPTVTPRERLTPGRTWDRLPRSRSPSGTSDPRDPKETPGEETVSSVEMVSLSCASRPPFGPSQIPEWSTDSSSVRSDRFDVLKSPSGMRSEGSGEDLLHPSVLCIVVEPFCGLC